MSLIKFVGGPLDQCEFESDDINKFAHVEPIQTFAGWEQVLSVPSQVECRRAIAGELDKKGGFSHLYPYLRHRNNDGSHEYRHMTDDEFRAIYTQSNAEPTPEQVAERKSFEEHAKRLQDEFSRIEITGSTEVAIIIHWTEISSNQQHRQRQDITPSVSWTVPGDAAKARDLATADFRRVIMDNIRSVVGGWQLGDVQANGGTWRVSGFELEVIR